jgi:farnesyl-diphosphate farnesyltransferase
LFHSKLPFLISMMDDWQYCVSTLPKVSRTFALNIAVLRGEMHRSVLVAYLFCRIVDTVEDAGKLKGGVKIKLLLEFARLLEDPTHRKNALIQWVKDCDVVDGSENDLDLISHTARVFNIFDDLREPYQQQIIPSVSKMARGMAHFQKRFEGDKLTPLEDEQELEEYCYFVAGLVGEMLCKLFFLELPSLSDEARETMLNNAVSFGLGLQMTNISKDIVADRERGWSYIPKGLIMEQGLTVEEFHSGVSIEKNLEILEKLLQKTAGHLDDALKFTLAIPNHKFSLRLFCIWPLWMAMETVAALHNNPNLLTSLAPVKISRSKVKRILWSTPLIVYSDFLLQRSFENILETGKLQRSSRFNLENLQKRLEEIPLDPVISNTQPA